MSAIPACRSNSTTKTIPNHPARRPLITPSPWSAAQAYDGPGLTTWGYGRRRRGPGGPGGPYRPRGYSRGMINGTHVILYSRDADADRVFFRDVLSFASVDAAEGWLIFKTPPAEIAVHPTDGTEAHQLFLMTAGGTTGGTTRGTTGSTGASWKVRTIADNIGVTIGDF